MTALCYTFSTDELAWMQAVQEAAMQDTALHLQRSTFLDDYNQPVETFTPATAYACGVKQASRPEGMDETEVPLVDIRLRMPLVAETVINELDRLQITHRFGVVVASPDTYEIVGKPERGPSGLVYNLKRMTE